MSKLQESITSEEMSGQDLTRSWSSHFPRSERARRQLLVSPEEREEEMLLDQEKLNMLLEEEEVEEMSLLDVEIWNLNRFLAEEEEEMSLLDLKIEIDD